MNNLTRRQQEVLSKFKAYINANGNTPTQKQLAILCNTTESNVNRMLNQLVEKNFLVKTDKLCWHRYELIVHN
tara:strand:- start:5 stop:223 length:219 start_codon:yes stop_codon:yes gene_type:complete